MFRLVSNLPPDVLVIVVPPKLVGGHSSFTLTLLRPITLHISRPLTRLLVVVVIGLISLQDFSGLVSFILSKISLGVRALLMYSTLAVLPLNPPSRCK